MVTEITKGVRVSVETFYQEDYSNPMASEFIFAYRVTIENASEHTLKLIARHWYIYDTALPPGTFREVEGEGVVGQQPVLAPSQTYQYVSGCNLKSEIGRMHGTYTMECVNDGKLFEVVIPEFELVADLKLN